jgi:hypothetical protein
MESELIPHLTHLTHLFLDLFLILIMPPKSSRVTYVPPPSESLGEVSIPARKPRAPMSEEAKAAMRAKRAANKALAEQQNQPVAPLSASTADNIAQYQAKQPRNGKRKNISAEKQPVSIDLTDTNQPSSSDGKPKRRRKEMAIVDQASTSALDLDNKLRLTNFLNGLNTVFTILASSGGVVDYQAWQDMDREREAEAISQA